MAKTKKWTGKIVSFASDFGGSSRFHILSLKCQGHLGEDWRYTSWSSDINPIASDVVSCKLSDEISMIFSMI